MSSKLNERRHHGDLIIRDNDLLTGKDAKRLVAQEVAKAVTAAMEEYDRKQKARRQVLEEAFDMLPWWQRVYRNLQFKFGSMHVEPKEG